MTTTFKYLLLNNYQAYYVKKPAIDNLILFTAGFINFNEI